MIEPDGTLGSAIMYEGQTLTLLAELKNQNEQINISERRVTYSHEPLSPEIQELILDTFTLKFADVVNPNSLYHFTDTVIPPAFAPTQLASATTTIPVIVNLNNTTLNLPSPPTIGPVIPANIHIVLPPDVVATGNPPISGPSAVEWIHPTGGLWSVGSNWGTGAVPTAADDAIIPAQNIPGGTGLYDVSIATPAVARNLTLNANNTTGGQVINQSTLTIGQVLTILNNGVLDNLASGSVSVGGKIELLDQSSLHNSGLITLGQGGDFTSSKTITNSGTIEIAGGTLNVQGGIANTCGIIQVDGGTTLKLNGAAIYGGTIDDNGSIDVTADSSIKGTETSAVLNNGVVTVESGVTLTLDNVTANGTIFADVDTGGTIQIDDGAILTLTGGATINGGIINDGTASGTGDPAVFGSIDVTGPSTISNAVLNNGGVTVASGVTLTLDNDTVHGTFFNNTASGAIIQIDDGTVLTLTGATMNGGTINDGTASGTGDPALFGSIDVTGPSTISNAFLNNGRVTVASGVTLTLNNDTVTGTTFMRRQRHCPGRSGDGRH